MPVPLKLNDPINLDVSYKFQDSLFEVKKIINGKIDREFYEVPLPVSTCLFFLRIKDWHLLDDAQPSTNPLVLTPPNQNGDVAIIFSFLGVDGYPFKPPEYDCLMGTIDLPENPLNKFCIGIAEDITNKGTDGFIIQVPRVFKVAQFQ